MAAPFCSLCSRPDSAAINARILRGDSPSRIAKDIGCSARTVQRHRWHIPPAPEKPRLALCLIFPDVGPEAARNLAASFAAPGCAEVS